MKNDFLFSAIGQIDDDLIESADTATMPRKKGLLTVSLVAVCLLITALLLPMLSRRPSELPQEASSGIVTSAAVSASEQYIEKIYVYRIEDSTYAAYENGRVIEAERVGALLEQVRVTAGWQNAEGKFLEAEQLTADVYEIKGISPEIAVCLRFLTAGEALTTTHYYVQINPASDTTPVQDYRIPRPAAPTGGEAIEEIEE